MKPSPVTHACQQVPDNLLQATIDPAILCKWLMLYVADTQKQEGGRYPSKMLYSLLTCLLRHRRAEETPFLTTNFPLTLRVTFA